MKRGKKAEKAPDPKPLWEEPFELVGWISDDTEGFHPLNDGNRYIFCADGYDWRPVYALRRKP